VKQVAILGVTGPWRWAEANVEGETLVASHPEIPSPVAIRYAWADNPAGCNLVNGAGLPAAPFRSDTG
jgi:sialate O-acetylesterase